MDGASCRVPRSVFDSISVQGFVFVVGASVYEHKRGRDVRPYIFLRQVCHRIVLDEDRNLQVELDRG